MENQGMALLFMIISAAALLFLVSLIKYCFLYGRLIRQAKMEIGRAYEWEERNHWERELLVMRLCVLPMMNPRLARRIAQKLYPKKQGPGNL